MYRDSLSLSTCTLKIEYITINNYSKKGLWRRYVSFTGPEGHADEETTLVLVSFPVIYANVLLQRDATELCSNLQRALCAG